MATHVANIYDVESLVHDEASNATAPLGALIHQNSHSIRSHLAGLQEKLPKFEKFLRELGIANSIEIISHNDKVERISGCFGMTSHVILLKAVKQSTF